MPILDSLFWKNPILLWLGRRGWYNKPSPTIPFAVKHLTQRLRAAKQTTDGEGTSSIGEGKREDLMAKFLNAKRDHPETVDDKEMLGMAISMVNAGSDTTAITLSAIFYYLLKNLRCLHKLVEELDSRLPTAEKSPKDSFKIYAPSFSDTQKLPYLDACINEGFRIHPALGGQPIERIVPKSGTTICGSWAPGGTQVACSPWVLHRNTAIYGEDVEAYRPERWLDDSPERVAAMQRTLFQFGGGAHTYIGKNISLLEIYKLVPSVLRAFEVSGIRWRSSSFTERIFSGCFDSQLFDRLLWRIRRRKSGKFTTSASLSHTTSSSGSSGDSIRNVSTCPSKITVPVFVRTTSQ